MVAIKSCKHKSHRQIVKSILILYSTDDTQNEIEWSRRTTDNMPYYNIVMDHLFSLYHIVFMIIVVRPCNVVLIIIVDCR